MKWYLSVLKNYAKFDGRASRSEYWYFFLFNIIISWVFTYIETTANIQYLNLMYSLAVLVPGIAVGVRRMHDVNKSGWYILIPIYNLILACTPGTDGPNQYGADPLRPEFEEDINLIGNN
jgi:uncharacterized membrane protein YhaH (DUF805 family)